MSKITNDGFTRSRTGCTHMATAGVKGLKRQGQCCQAWPWN